ncbi:hypothetical protein IQ260_18630 [Leptolyngbya cf. ectocarpi LEGE 11479]|uniref:Uncharacterized protein n=1 Tax=Leptolyngbya cf. ectocarpi LEGE 11479 TaxID=1828722 RepID=A0A928ZWC8_LEPEC|nr:hypothetical protein [Leptolyngbya ectocarpi]MBE9068665.1 hypothetical protein [Leptolyngbya cf. ectocarpi LEGE 11479]
MAFRFDSTLTLVPHGGLGNRMRAIDSAVTLSQKLQKRLHVIWLNNTPQLRCPFEHLFQPLDQVRIISPQITSLYIEPQTIQSSAQLKKILLVLAAKVFQTANFQKVVGHDEAIDLIRNDRLAMLSHYRSVMILTDRSFYPANTYDLFKPIPALESQIQRRTDGFGERTIGLHIRRGDHVKSSERSPLKLFEQAIEQEIARDEATNFYLASDSLKTKQTLAKRFGRRIITQLTATSRNSKQGMQEAVVDLYALSRTRKIYGSYWSSYSRVAANISNLELVILNTLIP